MKYEAVIVCKNKAKKLEVSFYLKQEPIMDYTHNYVYIHVHIYAHHTCTCVVMVGNVLRQSHRG